MENEGEHRDLIGDQIGWSVRQLILPIPELKNLDKKVMKILPRPIARIIAVIRYNLGLLPDVENPDEVYYGMLTAFCQSYLDDYGEIHNVNTVLIHTSTDLLKVRAKNFSDDQHEKTFRWDKQVEWAKKILERSTEQLLSIDAQDLKEAQTILYIQKEMTRLFDKLKPSFIKRGLPFPPLIK